MNTKTTLKIEVAIPALIFSAVVSQPEKLLAILPNVDMHRVHDYVIDKLHDRDGGPTLTDMQVTRFQYDELNGKGSFRLNFRISRQFCCSDISGCADDYLSVHFDYVQETFRAEASYFQWSLDN